MYSAYESCKLINVLVVPIANQYNHMTQVSRESDYGTAVYIGEPIASTAEAIIICETLAYTVKIFLLRYLPTSGANNIFGLGIRGRRTLQAFEAIEENVQRAEGFSGSLFHLKFTTRLHSDL